MACTHVHDTVNNFGSEDGARYDMHLLKYVGYLTDLVNNHARIMQFTEARIKFFTFSTACMVDLIPQTEPCYPYLMAALCILYFTLTLHWHKLLQI